MIVVFYKTYMTDLGTPRNPEDRKFEIDAVFAAMRSKRLDPQLDLEIEGRKFKLFPVQKGTGYNLSGNYPIEGYKMDVFLLFLDTNLKNTSKSMKFRVDTPLPEQAVIDRIIDQMLDEYAKKQMTTTLPSPAY